MSLCMSGHTGTGYLSVQQLVGLLERAVASSCALSAEYGVRSAEPAYKQLA